MSKRSIPNVDWVNQLESVIRQFVKEKLELIMREEIKHFLEIEQAGTPNMRNGYYQRNLDTQYGRIDVNVKINMYTFDCLRMYIFTRFLFLFLSDFLFDMNPLQY